MIRSRIPNVYSQDSHSREPIQAKVLKRSRSFSTVALVSNTAQKILKACKAVAEGAIFALLAKLVLPHLVQFEKENIPRTEQVG